jgi:hypothetical protein
MLRKAGSKIAPTHKNAAERVPRFAHNAVALIPAFRPAQRQFPTAESTTGDPVLGGWTPPLLGCTSSKRIWQVRIVGQAQGRPHHLLKIYERT